MQTSNLAVLPVHPTIAIHLLLTVEKEFSKSVAQLYVCYIMYFKIFSNSFLTNFYQYLQAPKTTEVLTFPWTAADSDVTITGAYRQRSWVLTNDVCGYKVEYNPTGEEPRFRLTLSNSQYDTNLKGFCGNKDETRENDKSKDKL